MLFPMSVFSPGQTQSLADGMSTSQAGVRGCITHRIHGTGIFTYIYHKNQLDVGKYTIHRSYGLGCSALRSRGIFFGYGVFWQNCRVNHPNLAMSVVANVCNTLLDKMTILS